LGKERDEETGLDYFGARYYAPWLARWTATDPSPAECNLYVYCTDSPVDLIDPDGRQPANASETSVLATVDTMLAKKGIKYNTEMKVRITLPDGTTVERIYDRGWIDPKTKKWVLFEGKGERPTRLTPAERAADKILQEEGGTVEVVRASSKPRGGPRVEGISVTPGTKVKLDPGHVQYAHGHSTYQGAPGEPTAMKQGAWQQATDASHPDADPKPPDTATKTRVNREPEYLTQDEAMAERARNVGPKQPSADEVLARRPAKPPRPAAPPATPARARPAAPEAAAAPPEPPPAPPKAPAPPPPKAPAKAPVTEPPVTETPMPEGGVTVMDPITLGLAIYGLATGGPRGMAEVGECIATPFYCIPVGAWGMGMRLGEGAAKSVEKAKPNCAETDSCPNRFMGHR
jgi:RHS repeat-associated protein